jgi:gas vesicle protein
MIRREESRHDFAFMAGVVIGAVTGALATLALAPRTGPETRDRWRAQMQSLSTDELRTRASNLREVAMVQGNQLKEAASNVSPSDVVQTTRAKVTDVVDRSPLPVTMGDGTEETAESVDELVAEADEAVNEVGEAAAELADEADTVIDETASLPDENADDDGADEPKTDSTQ